MQKTIPTRDAQPGMIVADPVVDAKGRMLIPADFRLTPLHITCLTRWGIEHIVVSDPPSPTMAAAAPPPPTAPPSATANDAAAAKSQTNFAPARGSEERRREIEKRLDEQFSDVIESPMMRKLKECALRRLARRVAPLPGQASPP